MKKYYLHLLLHLLFYLLSLELVLQLYHGGNVIIGKLQNLSVE